jgi:hypothetical protein
MPLRWVILLDVHREPNAGHAYFSFLGFLRGKKEKRTRVAVSKQRHDMGRRVRMALYRRYKRKKRSQDLAVAVYILNDEIFEDLALEQGRRTALLRYAHRPARQRSTCTAECAGVDFG